MSDLPDRKWILKTAKELLDDAKGRPEIDHQACARYLDILAKHVIPKGGKPEDAAERAARDAVFSRANLEPT